MYWSWAHKWPQTLKNHTRSACFVWDEKGTNVYYSLKMCSSGCSKRSTEFVYIDWMTERKMNLLIRILAPLSISIQLFSSFFSIHILWTRSFFLRFCFSFAACVRERERDFCVLLVVVSLSRMKFPFGLFSNMRFAWISIC